MASGEKGRVRISQRRRSSGSSGSSTSRCLRASFPTAESCDCTSESQSPTRTSDLRAGRTANGPWRSEPPRGYSWRMAHAIALTRRAAACPPAVRATRRQAMVTATRRRSDCALKLRFADGHWFMALIEPRTVDLAKEPSAIDLRERDTGSRIQQKPRSRPRARASSRRLPQSRGCVTLRASRSAAHGARAAAFTSVVAS